MTRSAARAASAGGPRRLVAAVALLATGLLGAAAIPAGAELSPPPAPAVTHAPATSADPDIDATAHVLVEAATGQVLLEHDARTRRPVASAVKILTALTALEHVDLDEQVTVAQQAVELEGSGVGLEAGETWSVEQLLEGMLVRSGNDAAHALAIHVAGSKDAFAALMRDAAADLGLGDPPLRSPSGLDDANRLSALDLATLARVALDDPRLAPMLAARSVELPGLGRLPNRNELLTSYPGADGVKTGFTAMAGNSLVASATRGGRTLIAVVLDAGDDPARFEQAAALLDHGFDRTELREVSSKLELAVAGGRVVITASPTRTTTALDADAGVDIPVFVRPPDAAPSASVTVDGEVVATTATTLDTSASPPPVDGPAAIGRAVVDGVYAGLRAAAADDILR